MFEIIITILVLGAIVAGVGLYRDAKKDRKIGGGSDDTRPPTHQK